MTPASAECRAGRSPWDEPELASARAAAFHKHGIAVLRIDEIADPWERRVVVNVAEKQYGRRTDDRG